MNKGQKLVLWISILVTILMVIFPPTGLPITQTRHDSGEGPLGFGTTCFGFLISYEPGFIALDYGSIDYRMLFLQFAVLFLVSGVLLIAFKTTKKIKAEQAG
jgi:hypothetical protein